MLFKDHLTRQEIQHVNNLRKATRNQKEVKTQPTEQPKKTKRKEKLSRGDLVNLMGMNRQTLKRERGAMRRK